MVSKLICFLLVIIFTLFLSNPFRAQENPIVDSTKQVAYLDSLEKPYQTNNGALFLKSGFFTAQKKLVTFNPTALALGVGVEAYFNQWVFGTEIDFTYRDHPDREKFFSKIKTPMLKLFGSYLIHECNRHQIYLGAGLGYLVSISPDYTNDFTTPDMDRYEHQNYVIISGRINYRFTLFQEKSNKLRFVPEAYLEVFLPMLGHDNFYADRPPLIPKEFKAIGPGLLGGIRFAISK